MERKKKIEGNEEASTENIHVIDLTTPIREKYAVQRTKQGKKTMAKNWVYYRPSRKMKLTTLDLWLFDVDREAKIVSMMEGKKFLEAVILRFSLPDMYKDILKRQMKKGIFMTQGWVYPACSLCAFYHLEWLNDGANKPLLSTKKWENIWNAISPKNEPFDDIGSMLDALRPTRDDLMYVPIRSTDDSENWFNTALPMTNGEKFDVPYDRVKYFFERHLEKHIPVMFNHFQHTRVAIAYDDTHILCIDTFGRTYEEKMKYIHWSGGCSIVDKLSVYQWTRDACIIVGKKM